MKTLEDISNDELIVQAHHLIQLHSNPWYGERETDPVTALTFVQEYIFISLELTNEEDPIEDTKGIYDLFTRLNQVAIEAGIRQWPEVAQYLAFIREE